MAKSRHSVVCLQMSHRQQRAPTHSHRPQAWVTSRRGCRLVDLQPHTEVQREQIQLLHPWMVASKQSRGRQNRQARRIAAQRSRKERMNLLFSVKREEQVLASAEWPYLRCLARCRTWSDFCWSTRATGCLLGSCTPLRARAAAQSYLLPRALNYRPVLPSSVCRLGPFQQKFLFLTQINKAIIIFVFLIWFDNSFVFKYL